MVFEEDAEEQTRRVLPDLTGEANTEQHTREQEARKTRVDAIPEKLAQRLLVSGLSVAAAKHFNTRL
ncbi:unnamed protein product [Arctogadus glacialis]